MDKVNKEIIRELNKVLNSSNRNIFDIQKALVENGILNKVFANIGLSNEYIEDDIEILDNYLRNEKDVKYTLKEITFLYIFALYLAKIFENNNENIMVIYDHYNKEIENTIQILLKDNNEMILYPITKLAKLIYSNDDIDLLTWYTRFISTYKGEKIEI